MDPEDVQNIAHELISMLSADFMWMVLQLVALAVVIYLFKIVAEGLAGYVLFKLDSYLCIGSMVLIDGKPGEIKSAGLMVIVVETKDTYIRVPTRDWRFSKYELLKCRVPGTGRRITDRIKSCTIENENTEEQ